MIFSFVLSATMFCSTIGEKFLLKRRRGQVFETQKCGFCQHVDLSAAGVSSFNSPPHASSDQRDGKNTLGLSFLSRKLSLINRYFLIFRKPPKTVFSYTSRP